MKQWLIAFVVLLGVVGGLAVGVFPHETEAMIYRDFKSVAFDRQQWMTDTATAIRLRMVNDLIYRHRIDTMSRDEILALLGWEGDTPRSLVYLLPQRDGHYSFLRILFDDSGKVQKAEVTGS